MNSRTHTERELVVWRARPSDGDCNACKPDVYGHMPKRGAIVAIRAGTNGGLILRLCEAHLRELIMQAQMQGVAL